MAKAKASPLAGIQKQLASSHKAHKGDETKFGMVDLPGGIKNGVAELSTCRFGQVDKEGPNKGKPYFLAEAIVVSPAYAVDPVSKTKVKCKGLRTSIFVPLYDQPKKKGSKGPSSFDDFYSILLNELRKMGVNTKDLEVDDLESVCDELLKESPKILFSTRLGKATKEYPDPKVFHSWNGLAEEGDGEDEDEEETDDDSEEEEEEEEESEDEEEGDDSEEEEEEEEDSEEEEEGDEEVSEEEEEEEEESEEEEWEPRRGGTCLFKPLDPKTKKKSRKAVECEIKALNKRAGTADLKNLETNKLYKGVSVEELTSPE